MAVKLPSVLGKTTPRIYTHPLAESCGTFGGAMTEAQEWYEDNPDADIRGIVEEQREWFDQGEGILPSRTHGYAAIRFAEDLLHLILYPWQKWLLIHALELVEDENGYSVYRFRIVIVEVARQNGKTLIEIVLALWHMFAVESTRTVIGTAQDLSKADDTWREAVERAESDEELSELVDPSGIYLGHPKSWTLTNGCEYRVASATRKGGRGFSGDLILLDELREHRSWDSWSAVTNTMNARPRAQAWAFSNAGDATSVVLRYQRAQTHRSLGWPDGEQEFDGVLDEIDAELAELLETAGDLSPGWFEWSAPPGVKRNDLDGLAQANPSMNHVEVTPNCPTTRTLLAAVVSAPAYEVETEVLCRWATMGLGGPWAEGSWAATLDATAKPDLPVRVVCVEVSTRRSQTYIARAGVKEDGTVVVGMRYDHPGTDWVLRTLQAESESIDAVVVRADAGSSAATILKELQEHLRGITILEWKSADVGAAHLRVFDLLRDHKLLHLPHHGLDAAATTAIEALKPGGGFTVDIKRSPTDVAPLYAAIGATWGAEQMAGNRYDLMDSVL